MKQSQAKAVAQDALLWLAQDQEALTHFLNATGASPDDVRNGVEDQEFLGFVLDFIMSSDDMVLGAAASASVAPETLLRARAVLPGGDAPNWT
ncbi:MAG: DUF3572 domain-containing protein [Pseudomonadota bacterium]